jgi:hypothetical protein
MPPQPKTSGEVSLNGGSNQLSEDTIVIDRDGILHNREDDK